LTAPRRFPVDGRAAVATRAPNVSLTPAFLVAHAVPVLLLVVLASVLMGVHADQWWTDRVYAWEGHRWALKSNFIAEDVIHLLGRMLSSVAWVGVLLAWIVARSRPGLVYWRRPLAYLLVSTLLGTLLVVWIKSWSNVDCPWDITRYGGTREYVGLLSVRPPGMPRAACFPAGHASAGYSWMALYFFFLLTRPRWRWFGLAVGVSLGLLFGISQQLRGAHFVTHDLWTAAICWASALGVYMLFDAKARMRRLAGVAAEAGDAGPDVGEAPLGPPQGRTQ